MDLHYWGSLPCAEHNPYPPRAIYFLLLVRAQGDHHGAHAVTYDTRIRGPICIPKSTHTS